MAGIKISDLPPNTLPLIGDEKMELENADGDSTRATVDDIAASAAGLDASFITVTANAALPNERVLTAGTNVSLVDTGPNGTLTINVTGGGFGDVFKVGIPVDNQIGVWTGDGTIEGDPNFTWDGSHLLLPQFNDQVTPTLAFGDGGDGFFSSSDGLLDLSLNGVRHWQWTDGTDSYAGALLGAGAMRNVTTSDTVPTLIPNRNNLISGIGQNASGEVSLIGNNVELARAVAAASGGLLANNTLTGAGIERVLTVSDLGGFGDVFKVGTPVDNQIGVWTGDGTIEGDPNFEWDGVTNTLTLVGSPVNIEGSNLYRFDGGILLDGGSVTTFNFASLFGGIQDHGFVLSASGINFLHNISGTPFVLTGDYTRFEVDRPIRVTNDTNVDWMDQSHDGTDYNFDAFQTADVNFTGLSGRIKQGAETLAFVSEIVVPDPLLLSSGGAGVPTYSFAVDTDTGMYNPSLDVLGFTAGGVLGFSLAEAGSHVIQINEEHVGLTASVTQTQAGGLALLSSYNEIATVGTTGDALTAFAVAVGERLVVINNGANDLQLFPAVGDDFGAGVDTAITIIAGEVGTFIGRDAINWDPLLISGGVTSFEGRVGAVVAVEADYDAFYLVKGPFATQTVQSNVTFTDKVTFTDVTGVQFDPSVEIDMRNPADDTTFFMQYVAAGVAWGLAGADFNSVFMDFGSSFTHFRFGDPILMAERAAAVADVAGFGQIWVNSVPNPNTLMYTDESGLDIDLTADLAFNGAIKLTANALGAEVTNIFTLLGGGSLQVSEKAGAAVDIPGEGQFWVRNDAPNTPMFTDDAGTDFELNLGTTGRNHAVQARRTTDYLLTTAFVDITMDVTDVETDATVLDHDLVTNTDNIIIGATGTYEIMVDVTADPDPGAANRRRSLNARVRLNDAGTGIAGSVNHTDFHRDATAPFDNHLSFTFIADLTATDFITLQLSETLTGGGAGTDNANEISMKAVRLL